MKHWKFFLVTFHWKTITYSTMRCGLHKKINWRVSYLVSTGNLALILANWYQSSKDSLTSQKYKNVKDISLPGNWTPDSRVTGGDTYHYTNKDIWKKIVKIKYLIQIISDFSSFPIPLSAWREFHSFSCVASTYI